MKLEEQLSVIDAEIHEIRSRMLPIWEKLESANIEYSSTFQMRDDLSEFYMHVWRAMSELEDASRKVKRVISEEAST